MAQGLGNPAGFPPGDTYPRHILDSINTSTDLPKKKKGTQKKAGGFVAVERKK